jgi:hypothetical protein
MAFFKFSSIYDVVIIFQRGFWMPDGTLNPDHSVSTKAKDILILILFQISYIFFGMSTYYNDRKFIESSSKMLNGGINFLVNMSFILSFVGRLAVFGLRYKFWKIVELLKKCDLLVKPISIFDMMNNYYFTDILASANRSGS